MERAYDEHGINPNTWQVHYAPQRSLTPGLAGLVPGDSLMRTCGSPKQANRTIRKLARRLALPRVFFDVVGPRERLARAGGGPPAPRKGL